MDSSIDASRARLRISELEDQSIEISKNEIKKIIILIGQNPTKQNMKQM